MTRHIINTVLSYSYVFAGQKPMNQDRSDAGRVNYGVNVRIADLDSYCRTMLHYQIAKAAQNSRETLHLYSQIRPPCYENSGVGFKQSRMRTFFKSCDFDGIPRDRLLNGMSAKVAFDIVPMSSVVFTGNVPILIAISIDMDALEERYEEVRREYFTERAHDAWDDKA